MPAVRNTSREPGGKVPLLSYLLILYEAVEHVKMQCRLHFSTGLIELRWIWLDGTGRLKMSQRNRHEALSPMQLSNPIPFCVTRLRGLCACDG